MGVRSSELQSKNIVEFMANVFCPGPYYYYVIDSPTLTLDLVSPSAKELLGIEPADLTIENILDAIHPDDVDFFYRCEDVVAHFLKNCITPDKMGKYKISYCLRERTSANEYKLFLLQTITVEATKKGALLKVFGTHTDISHITTESNRKLSLIGLQGEPSFMNIDVFGDNVFENFTPHNYSYESKLFTRREIQTIQLLGLGMSTEDIATRLNVAFQTVVTHRKNVLRKSGMNNTVALVADCIRKGII